MTPKQTKLSKKKIGDIWDETPLMPYVIAENVIHEAEEYLKVLFPDRYDWMEQLEEKANLVYKNNSRFRKKMQRVDCREWLYSFMRHWLCEHVDEFDRSLYKRLEAVSFNIGKKP